MLFLIFFLQGSSAPPRSIYPGAPPPGPATLKGAQRPAMTSPAGGLAGTPYRGTGWTPQGYAPAQQAYRYSAPLPQPTYAAYAPHTSTTVSSFYKLTYLNFIKFVNA